MLELKPDDVYEIMLGRQQIRLMPVGGSKEEVESSLFFFQIKASCLSLRA